MIRLATADPDLLDVVAKTSSTSASDRSHSSDRHPEDYCAERQLLRMSGDDDTVLHWSSNSPGAIVLGQAFAPLEEPDRQAQLIRQNPGAGFTQTYEAMHGLLSTDLQPADRSRP